MTVPATPLNYGEIFNYADHGRSFFWANIIFILKKEKKMPKYLDPKNDLLFKKRDLSSGVTKTK
jgi:hypothetical protein